MPEHEHKDKNETLEQKPEASNLKSPDAAEDRQASLADMVRAGKARTNASDGSLRKYVNADVGPDSIQIDMGDHFVGRDTTLSATTKLQGYVSNGPELSQSVKPEELLHLTDVALDSTAQVLRQPFVHLTENSALNNDAAKLVEHFKHDPYQLNKDVVRITSGIVNIIDKPMSPEERARMAGMLMPLFFLPGGEAPLDPRTVQKLELENLTEAELAERGIQRRMVEVYRGDHDAYSPLNIYGREKSFINEAGDLVPVSLEGLFKGRPVDIVEHLCGGWFRWAKRNSPYTSFTEELELAAKYGKQKVTLDLESLRTGIASGEVQGVEIIDHGAVLKRIEESSFHIYSKRKAMHYAKADKEVLVRGSVPGKYFKVEMIEE